MQMRHTALTILVPIAVVGGYLLTSMAGGFISDLWDDFAGPFLITYWIGLGFTNMWDVTRASLKDSARGVAVATVAIVILVVVGMLGGVPALIDDPWLFGVVVAPGVDIVLPYLRQKRKTAAESPDATV